MTRRAPFSGIVALLALLALLAGSPALAQQRFLLIDSPATPHELVCADTAVTIAAATPNPEVARLSDAATQAMILGDFEGALSFLDRALALDAAAAEPLYLRARILHQSGRVRDATVAFCRLLAVSPAGPAADEARRRLTEARSADTVVVAIEREFADGVAHYDAARLVDAQTAFDRVLSARPASPSATYNRGLVRLSAGQYELGRADLARYLTLARPDSVEAERA